MYSQNNESEVRRVDDEDASEWNETSYDIRRLPSETGGASSRNLTNRSQRIIKSSRNSNNVRNLGDELHSQDMLSDAQSSILMRLEGSELSSIPSSNRHVQN